jgi:type VI secretion system secreted protein VgrG
MADGSNTLSPASVWFVAAGETVFDVTEFAIEEPINGLFQVVVHASSPDGTIDPTTFIGKGGAFRFRHHAGDLVRAGICAEASQVSNQPDGAVTISTYRFVIVPALWRTTLRRNNRHFMGRTVPQIVFAILDEWKIPYDKDLKETHHPHEYRVQYDETDFAFISRLLEEEGISYWFDHAIKSGAGSAVTSVFFSDQPHLGKSLGAFPYRQTGKHKTFRDGENVVFDVTVAQRMKFGTATIRDFDLRLAPDLNLAHSEKAPGASADELKYEDYQYLPGAFRAVGDGDAHPTPIADSPLKVRTVEDQVKLRTRRAIEAARSGRTTISFKTSALEWAPGDVIEIGKGDQKHPSPQVNGKKMLVTRRHLGGTTSGIYDQRVDVAPADVPYRPAQKTPKARIHGLQSAIVVGPKDQEIHTDELGRVRVQFHWDREHGYDEKSSCWLRVSQAWAGGGFGLMALPRVGHEVLVGFYDGDPDRPVVVGRVFNRRNVVPETLAEHKTKSGWRTESSGGAQSHASRGYNELMFDDAKGKESVSIRAQKNMSTMVKGGESRSIGGVRSTRVGEVDVANVGTLSQVLVGKEVGLQMKSAGDIVLSTGQASIRLSGDNIYVEAEGNLIVNTTKGMLLSSLTVVDVVGGPEVCINCDENHEDKAGGDAAPTAIGPTAKPGGGPPIPPPFFPKRDPVPPPPPLGFEEIKVSNGVPAASDDPE